MNMFTKTGTVAAGFLARAERDSSFYGTLWIVAAGVAVLVATLLLPG
jgi:hypothetical protein